MITGAHSVIYSADAEADRAFLRDVLKAHACRRWPWMVDLRIAPSGGCRASVRKEWRARVFLDVRRPGGIHRGAEETPHCLRPGAGSALRVANASDTSGRRQTRCLSAKARTAEGDECTESEMTSNSVSLGGPLEERHTYR